MLRPTMHFLFSSWAVVWMIPSTSGFLFEKFQSISIKPDLLQISDKQQDKLLNIQLHIGAEDGPRMAVTDMVIELHHENADYEHTTLPGADGQHSKLSTGHRRLDIITEGHFINLKGTQLVKPERACWEMCWREDKPAGTLICGFYIAQDYQRNEAVLPKGEIYLSFPIWTREGLRIGQEEKRKTEEELAQYLMERDEALQAFDSTLNPIMKAIHIRNAFAATDKYNSIDHRTLETIPQDHQVFHLQDDLLLTVKGLVWTKDWEFKRGGGHVLLGYANVSPELKRGSNRLMP